MKVTGSAKPQLKCACRSLIIHVIKTEDSWTFSSLRRCYRLRRRLSKYLVILTELMKQTNYFLFTSKAILEHCMSAPRSGEQHLFRRLYSQCICHFTPLIQNLMGSHSCHVVQWVRGKEREGDGRAVGVRWCLHLLRHGCLGASSMLSSLQRLDTPNWGAMELPVYTNRGLVLEL